MIFKEASGADLDYIAGIVFGFYRKNEQSDYSYRQSAAALIKNKYPNLDINNLYFVPPSGEDKNNNKKLLFISIASWINGIVSIILLMKIIFK